MAEELIPPSVSHDDHLAIVVVPKATLTNPSAPTASILNAATRATYSFTPDGWNAGSTQETETDPRLALRDQLESLGRITNTLSTIHLYGSEDDVLDPLLETGNEIYFVVRDSVENEEDFAAGQKVDVWGVEIGLKVKGVTNGKQTKATTYAVKSINRDVAVV